MTETPAMSTPWAVAPPDGVEAFGAYRYWPEDLDWSTQLLRLISYSYLGGSEFSEIEGVARHLSVGDDEAWLAGFSGLAQRLDRKAESAASAGHDVTAAGLWRRACIYFRLAATFHSIRGIGAVPAIEDSRRCFHRAMELDDRSLFETVEIPYEAGPLPGYLISPAESARRRPTVIVVGGIDAYSEEMYFKLGQALLARGFCVLLPDGPGQGEALRRGIPARADYEVAASAMVDFLEARGEVDPERIFFVGSSMGGYFAARAAAFEPRIRAAVVWGAFYGIPTTEAARGTDSQKRVAQAMSMFAVEHPHQLAAKLSNFNLEGVATMIHRPTLVLHAISDIQVPFAHAQRLYEDIPHPDKTLVAYPPNAPGCTHCQLDAPSLAQTEICDWLEDRI